MDKLVGLTPLGRIWLDELNLLHRLKDDATAEERKAMIAKANEAAALVEAQFEALRKRGGLKNVNREYKRYREDVTSLGGKPIPWPAYAATRKGNMVRLLAREQAYRNRWRTT